MAYMDVLERDHAAAKSLATQLQHRTQSGQPGHDPAAVHALKPSTNSHHPLLPFHSVPPPSTAPVVSSAPVNYRTTQGSAHDTASKAKSTLSRLGGPSPEKGSGQDRFRSIIKNSTLPSTPHPKAGSGPGFARASASSYLSYSPPAFTMRPGLPDNCSAPTTIPGLGLETGTHAAAHSASKTEDTEPSSKIEAIPSVMTHNTAERPAERPAVDHKWTEGGKTYTALLSAECQKQHFNPSFTEHVGSRGFTCSVNIQGTVIHSRCFKSASEAKQQVSKRALAEVRKWGAGGRPAPAADNNSWNNTSTWKATAQKSFSQGAFRGSRGGSARSCASGSRVSDTSGSPNFGQHMMKNMIIQQIKDLYGSQGVPDDKVLSDPLLSRAFLEGYALGTQHQKDRLKGQGDHSQRRSRSRSPTDGYSRPHRERSPRMRSHRG